MKLKKEVYSRRGSDIEHFEKNLKMFFDCRFENEDDFIWDFVKNLEFSKVEETISKFQNYNPNKEKELVDYISKTSDFYSIINLKLKSIYNKYDEIYEEHTYPKSILLFVKEYIKYEELRHQTLNIPQTKVFYDSIYRNLETRILNCRNHLTCYLELQTRPNGIDALSAYLVLDRNSADNYFKKASISESNQQKFNYEAILRDWAIKTNDECYIPNIRLLQTCDILNKKVFEIDKIPINYLTKDLVSFQFTEREFLQKNKIKKSNIKNVKLFIELQKDLFQLIDKDITKTDSEVFLYSISNDDSTKYSNNEMAIIQTKINNVLANKSNEKFQGNKSCRLLFCAFIYFLKVNKFIQVNKLIESLDEYFISRVHLKKSTLNKYIYMNVPSENNFNDYEDDLKDIIEKYYSEVKKLNKKNGLIKRKHYLHVIQ